MEINGFTLDIWHRSVALNKSPSSAVHKKQVLREMHWIFCLLWHLSEEHVLNNQYKDYQFYTYTYMCVCMVFYIYMHMYIYPCVPV